MPPWQDVYAHFRQWTEKYLFEKMHDRLRAMYLRREGRDAAPTAAVLDSQSVKTSAQGGPKGLHAGRKVTGRKRHLIVNVLGPLWTIPNDLPYGPTKMEEANGLNRWKWGDGSVLAPMIAMGIGLYALVKRKASPRHVVIGSATQCEGSGYAHSKIFEWLQHDKLRPPVQAAGTCSPRLF